MLRILGVIVSILLTLIGINLLFQEDKTTRESVVEEKDKIIITHKKSEIKKITEAVDPKYKNKYDLQYY